MQIKDLGEFKVIDLLQSITAQRSTVPICDDMPDQLMVDNGDDEVFVPIKQSQVIMDASWSFAESDTSWWNDYDSMPLFMRYS